MQALKIARKMEIITNLRLRICIICTRYKNGLCLINKENLNEIVKIKQSKCPLTKW